MAYLHRKLLQETISINRSENPCQLFCDPANESGFCPTQCFSSCSSICYYPLQSLVPPTYNTPTTTSYIFDQETRIHKIFPYLIVTLVVLAIAFFIVCHYSIYVRFYSRRGRSQSRNQNQSQNQEQITTHDQFLEHGPELDHPIWYIRTVGLQPTVISAISVCKYKKNDGLVEGTECSVCLSEFQEGETLRLLPKCNHAFHIPCIDTWLGSHTNCPMCRAGIVVNVVAASPSPEPNVDILANSEETQVRISEEIELPVEIERNGIENSKERVGGIQPIRRSVSMDSASTSMASLALANNNAVNHPVKLNESSSSSSSMKRSLSSYSWRRTSVLPQ